MVPASDRPTEGRRIVKVGALVVVEKLEVLPWSQNRDGQQRSGIAYRAVELKAASPASAKAA
jgi:hypothetical protein